MIAVSPFKRTVEPVPARQDSIPGLSAKAGFDSNNDGRPNTVRQGRYRHYKGNDYIVLGIARHSETEEQLVVYRQDYGDHELWVRPKQMFLETVEIDGEQVARFQFVQKE